MILYNCETELGPLHKSVTLASGIGPEVSRSGYQGGKMNVKKGYPGKLVLSGMN